MNKILKEKKVSIIVNCYNGEAYLERAIKSILDQTYQNWEVVFWDNKSEDLSSNIIKNFKDDRIHYHMADTHSTLYDSRNKAITRTNGEFITFLDTDDTWEPQKLEKQINLFEKNDPDIIFSNYWVDRNNKKNLFRKEITHKNIRYEVLNNYPIGILTVMLKKNIFNDNVNYFNPKYEIIGDFELFHRLSKKYNFLSIDEPLATYYIHGKNASIVNLDKEILEIEEWVDKNLVCDMNLKNKIIINNEIRKCNYLVMRSKLEFNSISLKKLPFNKVKIYFYIKILLIYFKKILKFKKLY